MLASTGLIAAALVCSGCAITSSRDNVAASGRLVQRETSQDVTWRRDAAADVAADARVRELLRGGVTPEEALAIAFLANPEVQIQLERLEVSRADLIAATTFPNPVVMVGVREPGAGLARIYGDQDITVGLLQNILGIINVPARRAFAKRELTRVRAEVADRLVGLAAEVQEAVIQYLAAQRVVALRAEVVHVAQQSVASMQGQSGIGIALERNTLYAAGNAGLRAELERTTAREKLGQLMGLTGRHDDWQLAGVLPPLPPSDPALLPLEQLSLSQRLDMQAARASLDARIGQLRTTRRWRWIGDMEIGWFRERTIDGTIFDGPNAALELPLFDQRQSEIASRDAQARSAMRTVEALALEARRDIRTHGAELAATRTLLQRYRDEVLPNHRDVFERATAAPDLPLTERFHSRQAVLSAEEEEVGLLRDYWRARSALARAAGDWKGLNAWPATATPAPAAVTPAAAPP